MVEIQESMSPQDKHRQQQAEQDAAVRNTLGQIKHKFIVMSGKGGVGKTSTSVNLAVALAQKGHKVGIMDVDLHGPDVPRMLGLKGMLDVGPNRKLNPLKYNDNLKAVSIEGLTPDKDDAIIWRGPIKYSAIRQFIADVDWGNLDYLIIDSPPGTGDEPFQPLGRLARYVDPVGMVVLDFSQSIAREELPVVRGVVRQLHRRGGVEPIHEDPLVCLVGRGGVTTRPPHHLHPSLLQPITGVVEEAFRHLEVLDRLEESEESDTGVVVVVVAVIDRSGDPPQESLPVPGEEMRHLGVAMVGVRRSKDPGDPQGPAPKEVGTKRWYPIRITPVDPPRDRNEPT